MRKLLLFAMSAMVSMASFAQDGDDVTDLIQNAGFDEDLTWQADGSKKTTIDTKQLSDRSIAAWAEDSTVYATVNPNTPKSRSDGRTLEATNGFKGRIKGWTLETNGDFPGCEWTYFGSLPYALADQAIPVADDGNTYITVPAKPEDYNTDDNIGFVYMRAGWGGKAIYKQTVKLPCAKYRLEYWSININPSGTNGKNLSKVTCRKDSWPDELGFSASEWTKHEIEFTPTAEFTIELGFESSGGSNSNPFLCVDGIKLYKIDDADRVEIFEADLYDLATLASDYSSLATYIGNYMSEMDDMLSKDESDATIAKIEARITEIGKAIEEAKALQATLAKMDNILKATTKYPGYDALNEAYTRLNGYISNYSGNDVVEKILGAKEEAKAAIKAYYLSQVDVATAEAPADLTIFVKNPWFINEDAEPIMTDEGLVFPNQFDEEGNDLYKEGSASSPDLTSEGWYVAGISGGDQRLNWQRGRSCWNAWNNNFSGIMAVAQDIEGLPNGYYTVSADLITQTGSLNDQHVFLKTITDKKVSAQLTTEGWDNSEWETVSMTAAEKILVVNGKLTIGAEGTGTGSGTAGWFCATNFKLNFVGKASQEEIDKAINAVYTATLDSANAYAAAMHFKADKKALEDSIAKYKEGDKALAIEKIEEALAEANKSEAKYFDYLPTEPTAEVIAEKTLLWVKEILAGNPVEGKIALGASKPIVQFAYDYVQGWMVCDTATYTQFDATVDLLKNYVNTYAPVYENADTLASKLTEKGALVEIMAAQKDSLMKEMNTYEQVKAYADALKNAMYHFNKQLYWEENKDAEDFTAFIQNPNAEDVAGWTFVMGNGDGNGEKSGQWFDGSGTRYFDTYNSGGLQGFKASQLIQGLPNGTYKVGVYARTPAEGAYVFTQVAEADTTFTMIPLNYYQTVSEYSGEDTTVVASDKWGPIWEEAYQKYIDGDDSPEVEAIYMANTEQGRGWKHMVLENIVVTNHELLIGTMTGVEGSKAETVFTGAWYSVGGWTLTRTAKGEDGDWTGPVTGIQNVETVKQVAEGIYTITGIKANQLQRGLNIVVRNGKALKVMVK